MLRDELDLLLIQRLQVDGRATWKDLSEETGLSPSTVMERVRRLRRKGVLQGFRAQIAADKVGLPVEAMVAVSMDPHTAEGVESFNTALEKWPSVIEAWHLTGQSDFILRVVAPDLAALETVLTEEICSLPNIRNVETSIVLSVAKRRSPLPVPAPAQR